MQGGRDGLFLLLSILIRVGPVRVLESSNVGPAKTKAPCSKNMMGVLVNNRLVLIPFRELASNFFNISRNSATLLILNVRNEERKRTGGVIFAR